MALNTDYFRNLMSAETKAFEKLCQNWCETLNDTTIPEEAIGQIRSTIGQTKLLMNQRFNQFNGLIDDCEFKRGVRETKVEDLLGFWEMIYFQVEDVRNKFNDLDRLKANAWLYDTVPTDGQTDVPPVAKKTAKKLMKKVVNNNTVKRNLNGVTTAPNGGTVRKALSRKN